MIFWDEYDVHERNKQQLKLNAHFKHLTPGIYFVLIPQLIMAAAQQTENNEFEEAVTCPVCFSRYDDGTKKPKYLVACCHTVCHSCLEVIKNFFSSHLYSIL